MKDKIFVLDNLDDRMPFLKELLLEKNFIVMDYLGKEIKNEINLIYIFSPQVILSKEIIKNIKPYSVIYAFKIDSDLNYILEKKHITLYNFMKDDLFCYKNAMLTAEGLLGILIENSKLSFKEMNILLLGYGRTGKSIEYILNKLNISTTTLTTTNEEENLSKIYSKKSEDLLTIESHLKSSNIIINTIPAKILDNDILDKLDCNTLIIDISSNINIDMLYAKNRKIKVIHALSIPGKHFPSMSAKLMFDKILNIK